MCINYIKITASSKQSNGGTDGTLFINNEKTDIL